MVDFTDGMDFTGQSPEEQLLDKLEEKLTNRSDGYPSKHFLQWCEGERRGGLHLFTFRGEQPRIGFPSPSQCPAVLVLPTDASPIEDPYGQTAPHQDFLTLEFAGYLYTDDVDEIYRFAWLFRAALTKPFLKNTFDKLYGPTGVPSLIRYWPAAATTFLPWQKDEDAPPEVFSFHIPVTFEFETNLFK